MFACTGCILGWLLGLSAGPGCCGHLGASDISLGNLSSPTHHPSNTANKHKVKGTIPEAHLGKHFLNDLMDLLLIYFNQFGGIKIEEE